MVLNFEEATLKRKPDNDGFTVGELIDFLQVCVAEGVLKNDTPIFNMCNNPLRDIHVYPYGSAIQL